MENKEKSSQEVRRIIIGSVVISLIIGAVSGGLMGFWVASYGLKYNSLAIDKIERQIVRNLEVEESATIEAVKKAAPAVVSIIISKDLSGYYNSTGPDIFPFDDFFEFGFPSSHIPESENKKREVGVGTGFIVDGSKGLILTNRHVVADSEAEYSVITSDGRRYDNAEVLAKDEINDLAMIKINIEGELPFLEFNDSDNIQIGQTVIAIGFALGEFKNTVTKGIISGVGRSIMASGGLTGGESLEDVIQTDAAINPGNSGGPLIDLSGKVIGVNTAISEEGQLVGFAIPSNEAKFVFESVRGEGRVVRAYLGVRYIQINDAVAEINNLDIHYGALIVRGDTREELAVMPGSPADKAGLKENDIILEVDGVKIDEDHSLARAIGRKAPESEVELKILSKGEEKMIKVILEERK